VETQSKEVDVKRVGRSSPELLDNRKEVCQGADRLERGIDIRPESPPGGGKDEGGLQGFQRGLLFEEALSEASVIPAGPWRGMR